MGKKYLQVRTHAPLVCRPQEQQWSVVSAHLSRVDSIVRLWKCASVRRLMFSLNADSNTFRGLTSAKRERKVNEIWFDLET